MTEIDVLMRIAIALETIADSVEKSAEDAEPEIGTTKTKIGYLIGRFGEEALIRFLDRETGGAGEEITESVIDRIAGRLIDRFKK